MKHLLISTNASGNTTLVTGISGRAIRVYGYKLVAAGAVTTQFKSATTNLSGAMSQITGVPNDADNSGNRLDPIPVLQCGYGESLILALGSAVQVSGHLVYDFVG